MNPLEGNVDYYGMLNDIIELDCYNKFKVVLFYVIGRMWIVLEELGEIPLDLQLLIFLD